MIVCPKCNKQNLRLFLEPDPKRENISRIGAHCGQCRALYHYNLRHRKIEENMREEPNPPQGDPAP